MCPIEENIERCIASSRYQLNMACRKREHSMNVLKKRFISEDEDDIVSLDPPPKIVMDHWDINIVKMFSENKQVLLSATALMDLVLTYKLSLRNKTLYYAYTERLSTYIIHHLNYIHECFHDMQYYRVNMAENTNYYSLLEDVLAIYCSVELKTISKICFKPDSNNNRESDVIVMKDEMMYLKRLGKHAQKLAFILHNFLHRNENVLHVLMKMWYNVEAPSCVVTVRYLYTLLLHERPLTDKSDESYCRYVINYLLWIPLEKGNAKESMLGILNKKFGYDKGPPDSAFIKKVLESSGEKIDLDKLIAIKNMTIERYFNEIRKTNQRRMFDDVNNDDLRPYESFLFNSENAMSSVDEDLDIYDTDTSDDVIEIITLDSDDEDEVQIISTSDNKTSSNDVNAVITARPPPSTRDNRPRIRPPPVPTLHLHTPLIPGSMTSAARTKVQRVLPQRRTPHLDNATLSILHTIAEAAQKAQFSNNGQNNSVCNSGNSDSARDTFSDISERFAAKRAQVRNRTRPSADMNSISDMGVNPYMSPPSSSIGTPDNNYVEAEVGSPKCTTSIGSTVVHGSTNSLHTANLLLYTPDSQDEREDQSFELQPRTPTGSEDRDANSGLDEDHDTGQEQRKRREPPQIDISPISLPKRQKLNGDLTSILASPTSITLTTKGTTDNKNTSNILFTSNVMKRRRHNSEAEEKLPWDRDFSEQNKEEDIFSNLNRDRLKADGSPTKSMSQSVPDHRYPTLSPLPSRPIIPKDFTLPICYKAPVLELDPPVLFTTDNGVKGLLGSDVVLLGQQAIAVENSEVMRVATEMTHTEYVRDKGFVQVVSQPDDDELITVMRETAHRKGYIIAEDRNTKKRNGTPNKDILKEACADLLLHDADQDETIGTTSSSHTNRISDMLVITSENTNNLSAAAISPTSASSSSFTQQSFDNFQEQYQHSVSATSSCAGSIHGDEPSTLSNGLLSRVTQITANGDGGDRLSVRSYSPTYQTEDLLERDNVVTSPLTTLKEKNICKGVSTQVSSSSSAPSSIDSAKSLHDENYTLKKYLFAYPSYLDLSRRKPSNNKEGKMPEIGRKRPKYLINYNYPNASHTIRVHEIFCDDTKLCGKVGMDIQQIPFSRSPTLSKGNVSYTPISIEYCKDTQGNTVAEPLSLLYGSNNSFNSETNINCNIGDVSYTVSSSNDSVYLNKSTPSLTIAVDVPKLEDIDLEFSNSPKIFEETTKGLLEQMALQTDADTTEDNIILVADSSLFLANNTNYYLLADPSSYCSNDTSNACSTNVTSTIPIPPPPATKTDHSIKAITASPSPTSVTLEELTPEEEEALNRLLQESMANMNNSDTEGTGIETRLPFKKRRMSVGSKNTNIDSYQQPKRKQRNSSSSSKQSKTAGVCKEQSPITQPEISYPATKMISIAEVQEQNGRRPFKTAAERKEMPVNATATEAATVTVVSHLPFTPFFQCSNGNRSATVLNIPPPQSYNRSGLASHAYQYSVPVLPAPVIPPTQPPANVASAYYASLLTPQQFASSMIPTTGSLRTDLPAANTYACHHRLSGSVMAAATLAATTTPQTYKPHQRRRPAIGVRKDITTAARTRPTSVEYK